jgi:uncharacterized LabA/DUF88 family protein
MRAHVYIDGFNLYYRAVKKTPYKWLDLRKMCELIFPEYQIEKIKYFTARVSGRSGDPDQPSRQETYLRALRTIKGLEIIPGKFLSRDTFMPLSKPTFGNNSVTRKLKVILKKIGVDSSWLDHHRIVQVIKTEEKGSDVNIAAHLLIDGFREEYDVAIVVSNDSDLATPLKYVRDELGKPIILLNPNESSTSKTLVRSVSSVKQIRKGTLAASQFPEEMRDAKGRFHKPRPW